MRMQFRSQQRGITFLGLLFIGIIVACVGVVAAQVFPTVVEFNAIQKAVNKAAKDGTTPLEIRASFDRAQAIDDFKLLGRDLDITKIGDKIVVKFAYQREIHLAGPGYLVMKYEGQSK